ncbi:LytTR family DNA-binding domain-containing protein [Sediminibacterium sp.]|uniref:LytR/AlgR family response regulator transcription factor n=1 Tax=Sediminibacterium sp. TaxID=1917865 RepID=UPI002735CE83|nr:LytTR family DNA-binding domain-containing protein [Sediminibacterium sp.]MDP3393115.1 LytTR family DNA-binding domain-containing protein [Sediminibacterium sp.]MDP3567717.1 LytTR family DNA-binding domain-containing protein [Sediminibacterium sp.]
MYQCIIADDHLVERALLTSYIKKIPSLELVAECKTGLEVLSILKDQPIDIVFSDVDMPDLTGIELVKTLKNPPVFVFISSFPEYAAEGFNLDIIDFAVKPISFDRFVKAVNKSIEYIELKKTSSTATASIQHESTEEYFFIKDNKGITRVNNNNVLYIESMGDFSKIYTQDQKTLVMLVGLKNAETQLQSKKFIRVHKQYLVNTEHIIQVLANEIILTNKASIPLSNAYKQTLNDSVIDKLLLKRF